MARGATLLAAFAIAFFVAASPTDTATIVNSGSTNSYGYSIQVWSNGKASATLQEKNGAAAASPKAFTLTPAAVARFFADLEAARKENAQSVPCMKSVSFGTTTHITWQGWVSPDLSCPAKDALGAALVKDVDEIRQAAGIASTPMRSSGPIIESTP
jgi:hypothetical protein